MRSALSLSAGNHCQVAPNKKPSNQTEGFFPKVNYKNVEVP